MSRGLTADTIAKYMKKDMGFAHKYPPIPFKRGVNVTEEQYDIINKYIKNLQSPKEDRVFNYALRGARRCGKTTLFTRLIPQIESRLSVYDHNPITGKQDVPATLRILLASMTLEKVKSLYWRPILQYSDDLKLGYKPYGKEHKDIITPRGNFIHFRSLRDVRTSNWVRGEKFLIALIDEAQDVADHVFQEFIPVALKPAMTDYGGTTILTGTEPRFPFGFWYDISGGNRGYQVDKLNIEKNIFYSRASRENMIEEERKVWGWKKGDEPAWVKREFRGERVWDKEATVFHYDTSKNHYTDVAIPKNERLYVIGVDLGFHDADAFAVMCYSLYDERIYLVEEHVREKQDVTSACQEVARLSETYGDPPILVDTGSIGRKVMEELVVRYSVNAEAADKAEKGGWIQSMRAALHRGNLKIKVTSEAKVEMSKTEWNDKQDNWRKDGFHPNLLDAMVYAFREIYNMTLLTREPEDFNKEMKSQAEFLEERYYKSYEEEVDDEQQDFVSMLG